MTADVPAIRELAAPELATPELATPELNVTPLIDVLLVLLTMLILTVPVLTHSVKLELPAQPSRAHAEQAVQLDVDFDGRVYWNGEPVRDDAQLFHRLTQLAALNPPPALKITADRFGRFGRVAQVMAAASGPGSCAWGLRRPRTSVGRHVAAIRRPPLPPLAVDTLRRSTPTPPTLAEQLPGSPPPTAAVTVAADPLK